MFMKIQIIQLKLIQIFVNNPNIQMSLHCGFLFPKKQFKLINLNTIGYISDNVFYRLNMQTFQTEIVHHPQGRSYQAFTVNSKRRLIVLCDYGKNPTFYFQFHQQTLSFQAKNICALEVRKIQLSLNGKYLAIVCGIPKPQIIFYDIEQRKILTGAKNSITLEDSLQQLENLSFNPGNPYHLAVQFKGRIELYELRNCFQLDSNQNLTQTLSVKKTDTFVDPNLEIFVWDEINNLYISNKKEIIIYSTDTKLKVLSSEIEYDLDEGHQFVSNFIVTKKHLIVFYRNGRIDWLNKYHPDSMQQEEISNRPFYLDKFFETKKDTIYSIYDGEFSKIFITFVQGCFGILPKPAQTNQHDEDQDQGNKKQQRSEKDKKIDLDLLISPYYHASSIVLIHQFVDTCLCITLSSAGRFILWSMKSKKQLQTHAIQSDITCASVNKIGNVLATGHSNGVIRFYSIAKPDNIFMFKEFKMIKNSSKIDKIEFSTNGEQLVALNKSENKIFYILTNLQMEFEVLGFVEVPHAIKSMSWMGSTTKSPIAPKFQYVLLSVGFAILMVNGPASVPTKKRGKELDLKADVYALRTDANQTLLEGLPSGQLLTTGKDKFFKKYKQPEDLISKIDWKSKVPPNPPVQQFQSHDFQTQVIQHSKHFFISCGKDGKVHLRDYNNFKQFKQIRAYGWRYSNFNCISGSWNKGLIYTAGKDGSFYIWKLGEVQISGDQQLGLSVPNFKAINPTQNPKYYEIIIQEEYLQRMKESIGQKKKLQFQKLQKIKNQLKHLLQQNQKHQELQRLNRDQFAIDLQTKQSVAKQGQEKCKKITQQSKHKILVDEVYAKRLKEITWDRMEVHLSAINGLKNNYLVYNYQVRKVTAIQKRRVKLILDLRKAQKNQQKKRTVKNIDPEELKNKNIVNGGFVTPLVMTQIQAKKEDAKKDDKKKKAVEQPTAAQVVEVTEQAPTQQEFTLLYSAFELFNSNAKRNQVLMMKNIISLIKKNFNKEFNKLVKLRQNQNEMINDKNKRIIEICQELKKQNEIVIPRENILESSEGVLTVKASQIPFERYLSREEREKLQKQRIKQAQRLKKLAEDDSAQRALQKMMGGTLQQKKVSALQINVQRQKWMDKPADEMSQDEKLKLKEYEHKKQKAQEQKERLVKKLQAQLRKLKQEIDEIMQKYDERLFQLIKKKIQYDYRIQEQELYCARISLTLLDQQEESRRHVQLQQQVTISKKKLQQLAKYKELLSNHEQQFQTLKQQKHQQIQKQRLGEFDSKIKTIEKSVFEDYHNNVKKRRQFQQKLIETNPNYKTLLIGLDPMRQIESRYLSQKIQNDFSFFVSQIKALQQTFDIPENTIQKLLEHRFNIRKEERQLQQKQKVLSEFISNIEKQLQNSYTQVKTNQDQIAQIEEFLIQCKSDLDIQIRIKQGQMEINGQKPVPDLQTALLLDKKQIQEKNTKIKQQANDKISVMKEIKTCKIKVTEQSLNLQKKQQHIDKLSQMIKQIQMLKVKKEMQLALSKQSTKLNQNELKSLKQQIQKVRKQGQKRIALYDQKIKKIIKEIDTIKKQNKQLDTQKWNLQGTVKQRQKIKDMMCGDSQGGQQAAQKFDQISVNRKLFDKAKQQTQQIQLLREELSKLKAKTFANFSNVQR